MLRRPADAHPSLPLLADGDAVRQLRAAMASLAARDTTGSLLEHVRAWVGRVTGRSNRYVLEAVVLAIGEIADRCDELTIRLNEQEALTVDVARTFGEELARLRAEVLHLESTIDSPGATTGSAN
jgi:hypothetical protein